MISFFISPSSGDSDSLSSIKSLPVDGVNCLDGIEEADSLGKIGVGGIDVVLGTLEASLLRYKLLRWLFA